MDSGIHCIIGLCAPLFGLCFSFHRLGVNHSTWKRLLYVIDFFYLGFDSKLILRLVFYHGLGGSGLQIVTVQWFCNSADYSIHCLKSVSKLRAKLWGSQQKLKHFQPIMDAKIPFHYKISYFSNLNKLLFCKSIKATSIRRTLAKANSIKVSNMEVAIKRSRL